MFERRVKVLLTILLVALIGVAVRLIDLQIIHADEYREQAANALLLAPRSLPFVRGSILDRSGVLLASDEPSWDIKIDYGILAEDDQYFAARVSRFKKSGRYGADLDDDAVADAFRHEVGEMWRRLAYFSGDGVADLQQRAAGIRDRVTRVREAVAGRRGFDAPVAEERMAHTIVDGLDDQHQIVARAEFESYPWLKIEAVTKRRYQPAECMAHILGQLGPVDAEQILNDPYADDDLRSYRGDERFGVSGVELAAEDLLRGSRGRFRKDRRDQVLEDVKPQAGRDVHLTVRLDLQQRLYELMASSLPALPYSSGASVVVLDVPTREVLALVSYPGYDPNRFRDPDLYNRLRSDAVRMPLRFRAVANRYPPGSIVKPLTCLAGLSSGAITLDSRIECSGYLFPDNPDAGASKCWQVSGTSMRKAHGPINVVQAIEGSCNIFMYTVGSRVGVDALTNFFHIIGFGRRSGMGLREEVEGINPTPSWLNEMQGRAVRPADARLFAIGQGEVAATPLQVANLMATYAAGTCRPVQLILERDDHPIWELPISPSWWRAIREGLYKVVNSPDGTAYKYARLVNDRYALCGKTGSATAQARPISYRVAYTDEQGRDESVIVPAGSRREARESFAARHPGAKFEAGDVTVHSRFPDRPPAEGGRHSHAWFAGYLHRLNASGAPAYDALPRTAFAVLVEYGGSGGRTSGPIARQVAEIIIETLGDDLDPHVATVPAGPD